VSGKRRWQREQVPRATAVLQERLKRMPMLLNTSHPTGQAHLGVRERGMFALINTERLRRVSSRMLAIADRNAVLRPGCVR
jgi:hypothetical protein